LSRHPPSLTSFEPDVGLPEWRGRYICNLLVDLICSGLGDSNVPPHAIVTWRMERTRLGGARSCDVLVLFPPSIMTTRVDHKALRELCHLLVESLQNSYCVMTQLGLMQSVAKAAGQRWETDPTAVKIMHAVYNTCFEWVARARSDAELEELRKPGCHCTGEALHLAHDSSHKLGRQLVTRNASLGWTMVLAWILLAFDQKPSALDLAARGVHMLSRRTGWPRSIASALPHGPERTVHALLGLF
jgi:hypothetical protein